MRLIPLCRGEGEIGLRFIRPYFIAIPSNPAFGEARWLEIVRDDHHVYPKYKKDARIYWFQVCFVSYSHSRAPLPLVFEYQHSWDKVGAFATTDLNNTCIEPIGVTDADC